MSTDPFAASGFDVFRVNFQRGSTSVAPGYAVDNLRPFSLGADGFFYGWVTEASVLDADGASAAPIDRELYPTAAVTNRSGGVISTYDARLRGSAHFDLPGAYPSGDGERIAWEVGLAPGWYTVTASVGDVAGQIAGDDYRLFVEGIETARYQPTLAFRTELVTTLVEVTDGFLTLSAQGGTRTRIQYVEVSPVADLTPGDGRAAPQDYAAFRDLRAVAQDGALVFETALAPDQGFAAGVDPEADIFVGLTVVDGRGGVDLASLVDGSIRLVETLTGAVVAVTANTTAGGDSITIEPVETLKPNTSYTLILDGVQDRGANDDSDGPRPFQKLTTTFLTGDLRADLERGVAFTDKLQIDGASDGAFGHTSLALAPGGSHLYASTITGQIIRWALDAVTGAVIKASREAFAPGGDFETPVGRRGIIGLAFDPEDSNVLWISDNWPIPLSGRDNTVPEFSGRISKVTLGPGGDLTTATVTPYVTGLPRSNGDHVTNSLDFRLNPDWDPATNPTAPKHLLYVVQGSNTAMGAADSTWGFRPERLLTAAVLEIDPTRAPPPGGFDVTTEPLPADGLNRRFADVDGDLKNGGIAITSGPFSGAFLHFDANGAATVRAGAEASSDLISAFYDPFAPDAVLKVFATGARNAYDLVWHSNGQLYVPTNGSAAGGNVPDDPATAVNEARSNVPLQPDFLFRMEEGGYFGHPNPLWGRYVLNGGNPTSGVDPFEVVGSSGYAVGTLPDPGWNPDRVYSLGNSRSPNGVIEYTSDVWGDKLLNALIVTEYSGGNGLRALLLDQQGRVTDDFVLRDFSKKLIDRYLNPLDLVVDPQTGRIYMTTLNRVTGESQIVLLDPAPPPLRIEAEDFTIASGFTVASNGAASGDEILAAVGAEEQRAFIVFTGPSGLYDVGIGHFDENDGVARLALFVNGAAVDGFLWDENFGSSSPGPTSFALRTVPGVFIDNGAVIELRGFGAPGEPLRTDFLEFAYRGAEPTTVGPANSLPSSVDATVDTPVAFTGVEAVTTSDADSALLTTTLRATNGTLSFGATTAAVIVTENGAATTISGSTADVNAALSGLVYTPDAGFIGQGSVTVQTSDGAFVDTDVIAVDIAPFGDPNAKISAISRDPGFFENRLHFNYIDDPDVNSPTTRAFKDSGVLVVTNDGTAPLEISGFELSGPFRLTNPAQLTNVTLAAGQSINVTVEFDRAAFTARSNSVSGVFTGALQIFSNDQSANTTTIDLAGHWQSVDEGGREANVNEVWEVFGFGNRIPDLPFIGDQTPFFTGGVYAALNDTEILSPYFRIADGVTEARIVQIARYSGDTGQVTSIHRPFVKNGTQAVNLIGPATDSQTILPRATAANSVLAGGTLDPLFNSATFTRETIPDGWVGDDVFGIRLDNFSTDPSLNTIGEAPDVLDPTAVYGHWTRVFQALDASGAPIPNVYLVIQDLLGLNQDFNDTMAIVIGVTPVSRAPVNTAPATVTAVEDTSFAFTGANAITVLDPDGAALTNRMTTFLEVQNGSLSVAAVAGVTVTGNGSGFVTIVADSGTGSANTAQNRLNATLASLVYTPDANFDGVDSLRIVTNDRALSDADTVAITVTNGDNDRPFVVSASAPAITAAGGTSVQVTVQWQDDTGLNLSTLGTGDIRLVDPFGGALSATSAQVTAAPGGKLATVVYTFTAPGGVWDGIDNGVYAIAVQPNEVRDTASQAALAQTVGSFEVAVPLPPPIRVEAEALTRVTGFALANLSAASGGQIITAVGSGEQRARTTFAGEAGRYSITVGHFDENDGVASMSVVVNGQTVGSWFWDQDLGSPGANAQTRATKSFFDVTLRPDDIVELVGFSGPGEPLRTDYIDFQFLVPLTAGNQRPNNVRPATVTTNEDVAFAFTGANAVSVSDPDSGVLTTTLSSTNGVMSVATGGGATVSGNGTAAITVSGSPAAINAALAGLQFTPAPNYFGPASIVIQTSDGSLLDTDSIAITVAPVNDAPTAQNVSASTPRNTELSIALPIADAEDSTGELVITVPGASAAGGLVVDNGDGTVTYTPPTGFTGADSFTYSVTDTGLLSSPSRTVSITVLAPNAAPTVQSATAASVTVAGGTTTTVTVTFADDGALNIASFNPADILVAGPGGALTVTGVSVNTGTNGSPRTVTYTVAAPGGTWDSADNGSYTVSLVGNQVFDTLGLAAAAASGIATFTVAAPPPSGAFRVEAEALQLVQGFTIANNNAASGGRFIAAVGSGEQIARYGFAAEDGLYDLTVGYFDENDGVAQLALFVNGAQIDRWFWDANLGTALANAQSRTTRSIEDVALRNGDTVELRGFGATGEPLRTDFIDFTFDRAIPSNGFRVEAESFTSVQGFAPEVIGPQASGDTVIRATGSGEQIASYVFGAAAGLYNIDLRYFDENDGDPAPELSVFVNGTLIDSFVWNVDLGAPIADFQTQATRTIDDVALRPGDVITLQGTGDVTPPSEPLRVDYLDFSRIADIPPPAPFRVEAEALQLVQGFTIANNNAASGGRFIAAVGSGEQIARYGFAAASGIYDLTVGYFDENDGVAQLALFVNNAEVDRWFWDANLGTALANAQSRTTRSIEDVALQSGDTVELRGFGATGEPLRTDFIDFAFVGDIVV